MALLANSVQDILMKTSRPVTAAVMGCIVNGPGEAKHADIGIAGGDKKAALFAKGELIGTYAEEDILNAFTKYLDTHF